MSRNSQCVNASVLAAILAILLILLSSCGSAVVPLHGSTSTPMAPATKFPLSLPPATPLICPQQTAHTLQGSNDFVQTSGTQFVYRGKPLNFTGFTFYPATLGGATAWQSPSFPSYINRVLDAAQQLGQNIIRTDDLWNMQKGDDPQGDQTIWRNVDYLVCTAAQRGMFVELDISSYEWFLQSQHYSLFNVNNWLSYLAAVGRHYSNQPTIAFYYILGEPAVPTTVNAMNTLITFYRAMTDALYQADDGHHLIIAGGFNHMENETPQLRWWQKIYALPHNNVVAFKTYSQDDLNLLPTIASYAYQIHKPLLDEEFGMVQGSGDATYSGIPYNGLEMSRAAFFRAVYSEGRSDGVKGFIFWNLGCKMDSGSYDVNPETPAVWHVIQQFAAVTPENVGQSLCGT
jgi:hypothetical protein